MSCSFSFFLFLLILHDSPSVHLGSFFSVNFVLQCLFRISIALFFVVDLFQVTW